MVRSFVLLLTQNLTGVFFQAEEKLDLNEKRAEVLAKMTDSKQGITLLPFTLVILTNKFIVSDLL
jgi:hypothetical protein